MEGESYQTVSKTEFCPECGQPIVYGHTKLMGQEYSMPLKCQCIIEREEQAHTEHIRQGREYIWQKLRERAGLSKRNIDQRFRNYIPDTDQVKAFEAARSFAKAYIEEKSNGTGLLLIGGVGSGKTHLAAAIVNAAIDYIPISDSMAASKDVPYSGILFIRSVSLMEQLRAAMNTTEGQSPQDITRHYQEAKLLVLDDLGAEKPSDWVRERLFEIIDQRYNDCTPTVITTNANIDELRQKLGDRVCDRIRSMCATYTVTAKSHRKTADNTQPKADDRDDFDTPPVIPKHEKTIYDRMRE